MKIGHRVYIYSSTSAMHGCIEVRICGGFLCIFPPIRGRKFKCYWSPNGTPWHHATRAFWGCKKQETCVCDKCETERAEREVQ